MMRTCGVTILISTFASSLACWGELIELPAAKGTITPPFYVMDNAIVQTNDTPIESGGKATYTFTVSTPGDYVVYAEVGGKPGKSSALSVSINEENLAGSNVWQFEASEAIKRRAVGSVKNATKNRNYAIYRLEAGTNQLVLRAATAGTRIEKLLIRPHNPPMGPVEARVVGTP